MLGGLDRSGAWITIRVAGAIATRQATADAHAGIATPRIAAGETAGIATTGVSTPWITAPWITTAGIAAWLAPTETSIGAGGHQGDPSPRPHQTGHPTTGVARPQAAADPDSKTRCAAWSTTDTATDATELAKGGHGEGKKQVVHGVRAFG